MQIITYFFILTIVSFLNVKAQQPNPESFFPSAVGNYWEYDTDHGHLWTVVAKDSIDEDGNKYLFPNPNDNPVYKIDASFYVYYVPFDPGLNWKVYKLDADSGDTWTVRSEDPSVQRREAMLFNVYEGFIFGEIRTVKEIKYFDLERGDTVINERAWLVSTQLLVEGIGEYITYGEDGGPTRILSGCIIDGVTLGTITTSVEEEELSTGFKLYQNYPNPFNPETIIKYKVASSGIVTIKVYDLIGREVETLVNEYKQRGVYEITFDGGRLSSGLYIYSIETNGFRASKKIMLIK